MMAPPEDRPRFREGFDSLVASSAGVAFDAVVDEFVAATLAEDELDFEVLAAEAPPDLM